MKHCFRYQYYIKIGNGNKDWWLMVVIPTLRSLRQEHCCLCDVDLRYTEFQIRQNNFKSQHMCCLYLVCIYFGCLLHQNLVSSPFHGCYSFVRIYQSLAIPFLTETRFIVLTHPFEKLVFNVETVDRRGYLECQQLLQRSVVISCQPVLTFLLQTYFPFSSIISHISLFLGHLFSSCQSFYSDVLT